ncbi:Argininosuccinate lyase [Variovorax sp. PBS-H4]|uniref:Bug family tripartite tricarboxylate transporter substrate binding protein n=1 Tax=Variovorax sp. PBS-H4 TaxID=434008 RepID=UPI00131653C4|nr:tripartite tricarboxylate transporter substrate binding protein [Variovorax sp. PBS-H4]VTU25960.1 Argininosuccinate lyase [Variovorax sp. PBS-H4]
MRHPTRRSFCCALAAATVGAGAGSFTPSAHAQTYPAKPIRMIVPWPAGGSTDVLGRALGTEMGKQLGQPVIIDNRSGGAGKIGTALAATSPADGYTIYLGTIANFSVAAAYEPSLRYDPIKDFAPVAYVADSPAMLAVSSSLPVHNLKELRDYARTSGRQLTYASAGEGSGYHLMGELFKLQSKLDLLHVPFQGTPPAATAVAAGQVDMTFDAAGLKPFIESGKLRPIAVTGKERWAFAPDAATFASQGVDNLEGNSWFAIFVPSGTPQEFILKLNGAINKSLASPELLGVLKVNGYIPVGGTPGALGSMVAKDMAKWKDVVQTANLRAAR